MEGDLDATFVRVTRPWLAEPSHDDPGSSAYPLPSLPMEAEATKEADSGAVLFKSYAQDAKAHGRAVHVTHEDEILLKSAEEKAAVRLEIGRRIFLYLPLH